MPPSNATASASTPDLQRIIRLEGALRDAEAVVAALTTVNLPPAREWFADARQKLEQQRLHSTQRFTVVMLGEFNAGKTTLLNALLEFPEGQRLPVSDQPTTRLPVRLSFKRPGDPEARWTFQDGSTEDRLWDDAAAEAAEKTGRRQDIREIQLFVEHPLLAHADLLDLPGTGTAHYTKHTDITRDYLFNAEVILWVVGFDEPSRDGRTDIRAAREKGVPVVQVFNAWGGEGASGGRTEAELLEEQNELEASVRKHAADEGLQIADTFRVYGLRALERLDDAASNGQHDPETGDSPAESEGATGLGDLRMFLVSKYLGEFVDHAHSRRENVLRQVDLLAERLHTDVASFQRQYEDALEATGAESDDIKHRRRGLRTFERNLRSELRDVAGARAQTLLTFVEGQVRVFLENKLVVTNTDLWKNATTKRRRKKLEEDLSAALQADYLKIDNPDGLFQQQIREYLESSLDIVQAEWEAFVEEMEESATVAGAAASVKLPYDQIRESAMGGIRQFIGRLLGVGAVLGVLALIPGGAIVDAVLGVGAMLVSLVKDPLEGPRETAIRRFHNELVMQREGLRADLVDALMTDAGPHGQLKNAFLKQTETTEKALGESQDQLRRGLGALESLRAELELTPSYA